MTNRIEPVLQIEDIASAFRVSIPTVKRWLHDAKQGKNNFPIPISGVPGRRLAWSKTTIEDFINETSPVDSPKVTPRQLKKRHAEAMQELSIKHGIGDKQAGKEVAK